MLDAKALYLSGSLYLFSFNALAQVQQLHGFSTEDIEASIATGVNPAGQIAGIVGDHEGKKHAVLYDGRLLRLDTFGGEESETAGINHDGMVIGSAETKGGSWRAFLYRKGEPMRDLGSLGGHSSFGMGVNDVGQAVGMAQTSDGYFHAFGTTTDGKMEDLGTLGGKVSNAAAINNKGEIVGTSATVDDYRHAFLYRQGVGMTDLGTLGGHSSAATGINAAGQVVGASEMPNRRWHAFLYDGRKMIDLGAMIGYGDSFATGINAAGHVVGTIVLADERRTFVYRDGKINVHHAGKALYLTNGINDREQVIGASFTTKRYTAAVMPANMVPIVDHGREKIITMSIFAVVAATFAVIGRKCYLGSKATTG
jgi:probable HAF family extracellular repeat protein